MRCERIVADEDPGAVADGLRALIPEAATVSRSVAEIIDAVRAEGDDAVLRYTRQFDTRGAVLKPLEVPGDELDAAAEALDPEVRHGLDMAIHNLSAIAHAEADETGCTFGGHEVRLSAIPVQRAAVYVPGGRAPYPSTVVMGVVPAKLAGVPEVAACAPPRGDGEVDPVVLAAARLAGASRVYRMGGAQAIAALAYGTQSVTPVDVIVGPGNLYVQEAKRQVFGLVGIDGFAGPSDLVVIATHGADPALVALDLLAQAEHGPGTLVAVITASDDMLDRLEGPVLEAPDTGAIACLVRATDAEHALAIAERFAPEHLELVGDEAEALADRVTAAGCLFVGADAGTAFGDYVAGSNHILPTGGAARFSSALSPQHFLRRQTTVRISNPDELARAGAPIARAEGFELHARSMEARIRDNQPT